MCKVLHVSLLILLLAQVSLTAQTTIVNTRPMFPYKVLLNNDCTNIGSCISPFNPDYKNSRPECVEEMLIASVDEAANSGVEAFCFSPGMGWTPWWPSKVVPNHYQWYRKRIAKLALVPNIHFLHRYVEHGGDVMAVVEKRCKQKDMAFIVAYRPNDVHHLHKPERPEICQFYAEHPEYRIGAKRDWSHEGKQQMLHNWIHPEVRNYKLALITELCENYDIDGIEISFLHHNSFFQLDRTTTEQRADVMAGFLAEVRAVLDATAKTGKYRYLGARIPDNLADFDALGIDIRKFSAAGVDFFNASPSYWFSQRFAVRRIKRLAGDRAVLSELSYGAGYWKNKDGVAIFRRGTDEMLWTTAWLAYQRGADGISLFNFQYYRAFGTDQDARGPFSEPPYHVVSGLKEPKALRQKDQYYFQRMAHPFVPGQDRSYRMDMAPTDRVLSGRTPARLRAHIFVPGDDDYPFKRGRSLGGTRSRGQWKVCLNGVELDPTDDTSQFYRDPYEAGKGDPAHWLAWLVPKTAIADGHNVVEMKLVSGQDEAALMWIEVGLAE